MKTDDERGERPRATDIADSQEGAKTPPFSLGNKATAEAKPAVSKKPRKPEWQQVNTATWQLVDPDGPKIETPRCHGHWPGFLTPTALAYVFDVGVNDWRVRVRQPGNRWRAWGCSIDLATAKRIAQEAVENPNEPRPSKFKTPLNPLRTRSIVRRADISSTSRLAR
jgi:hypothetical protein